MPILTTILHLTVVWIIIATAPLLFDMPLPVNWLNFLLRQWVRRVGQLLPAIHDFNSLAMGNAPDFTPWGSVIVMRVSGLLAFVMARICLVGTAVIQPGADTHC